MTGCQGGSPCLYPTVSGRVGHEAVWKLVAECMAAAVVPGRSGPGRPEAVKIARTTVFSGITFATLFTLALVLVNQIQRLDSPVSAYTAFYTSGSGRVLVTAGLYLVPFAGIALLLFMMAFKTLPDRPADLAQALQLASGSPCLHAVRGTAAAGAAALMLHFANVPALPVSVDRVLPSRGRAPSHEGMPGPAAGFR